MYTIYDKAHFCPAENNGAVSEEQLEQWIEKYRQKAVREFKKEKKFPACRIYEYKSSEGNDYRIFFYVENRKYIEDPKENIVCIYTEDCELRAVKWSQLDPQYIGPGYEKPIRVIEKYNEHFFKQYNNRCIKDNSLSKYEIVCKYFSRNLFQMPMKNNSDINSNYLKHGDDNHGVHVFDGLCFADIFSEPKDCAQPDVLVYVYRTFMNESGMKDNQIKAINKGHNKGLEAFFEKYEAYLSNK